MTPRRVTYHNRRLSLSLILPVALAGVVTLGVPASAQNKPKPQTPPKGGGPRPTTPKPAAKPAAKPAEPKPAAAAPAEQTPAATGTRTWALLVGISKYSNPSVSALRFPAADATSIRDALTGPDMGGVPAENVKLLTNEGATRSAVLGAIDSFLKPNVKPGDRVVVFLAGHGVAKGVGTEAKSYLLPYDVTGFRKEQLESSAVSLRDLSDKLSDLPASQFVVFMDACREDPIPGRGVKGNLLTDVMSRGMQIVPRSVGAPVSAATFFACGVGQRAFEDPSYNHGVFTYHILDGIGKVASSDKGEIDLGLLARHVENSVKSWADNVSKTGAFEVEQTPELIASSLENPIIVMTLRKPPAAAPSLRAAPPTLLLASEPAGAQVTVNGRNVGASPVVATLPGNGEYAVSMAAPGYAPVERKVKAFEGYPLQVEATLAPGARGGGSGAASGQAADLFTQAQNEIKREQWEVADATLTRAYEADAAFSAAYEAQAELRRRRNRDADAIVTLATLVQKAPESARSYSLLSRAYAIYSLENRVTDDQKKTEEEKKGGGGGGGGFRLGGLRLPGGGGGGKKEEEKPKESGLTGTARFVRPVGAGQAATLAAEAAAEAVKLDANDPDAQVALGFALLATDNKDRKNRAAAEAAFGKAVSLAPNNADAHYGLGYGIRRYAQANSKKDERDREIDRAITSLKKALELRPEFYEAHRELGFCYHLKGDLPAAKEEYETANAHRGAASDESEVAAINLSLSAVCKAMAKGASGDTRTALDLAGAGYFDDAKEITPDLLRAVRILAGVNLTPSVADYLPGPLKDSMRKFDQLGNIFNVPGLPGGLGGALGGLRLPGF